MCCIGEIILQRPKIKMSRPGFIMSNVFSSEDEKGERGELEGGEREGVRV